MTEISAPQLDANRDTWLRALRGTLFMAIWGLVWITLDPFGDLGSEDLLGLSTGNDFWVYVCFGLLAILVVATTISRGRRFYVALGDPGFICLSLYIAANIAISADFAASLRRYVLYLVVAAIAALVCLLPKDRDEFGRLLVASALFVAVLSYAGVFLVPQHAVHQATDLVEARLAGDWRGVFGHKNLAGGVFATMVFIGIFAVRIGMPIAGGALCLLAGLFVILSAAKSSIIIVVLVLLVSAVGSRATTMFGRGSVVLGPLLLLLCLGVGSVIIPAVGSVVASLPFDATFTGRSDVWAFAFEKFLEKPITGYGFLSFWSLESTKYGVEDSEQWAGSASNGHNGFLDTALNLGLIGLVLTIFVLVVAPLVNDVRARRSGADPALMTLFFQLWLFGIYLSCMESFLFSRADPIWFTLLVAIFGLRLGARFNVTASAQAQTMSGAEANADAAQRATH
jgi:O-antigen ligase